MATESDLTTSVLSGARFIKSSNALSNVTGASADYTKLFTLYQGLAALEGLANKATDSNISAYALAQVQRRFTAGLAEVGGYIGETKYDHLALNAGTLTNQLKNDVGAARTDSTYTAPDIQTGSASTAARAFEGNVVFDMSVKKTGTATPIAVHIDLSEMGATTRSMSNVVSFINGKLSDAGLSTRFAVNRTAATPVTTTLNGKTTTLSAGQDTFGLQIKGTLSENLTFSALNTADSVYIAQTTGDPDKKVTAAKPTTTTGSTSSTAAAKTTDVTSQLVKFQTDVSTTGSALDSAISKVGNTYWVDGESGQTALPDSITNVRQTVSGPDGSVYMLADVNGDISGQQIKGAGDVALVKLDSAGKVVYTRTLGASDMASGLNLAVSPDGKIAIAGSVTGALDVGVTTTTTYGTGTNSISATSTATTNLNGANATTKDSFVTVFDASGVEQWTQRRGSNADDEATAVAFAADGSVYVGGRTMAKMTGATGTANGSWDGYLMGFSSTGAYRFTQQTGTANSDTVSQIVTDGNTVYVAGVESGNATLKSYTVAPATYIDVNGKTQTRYDATQTGSRDLGGIGGGGISGMSIYDGKVYLGGSSGSNGLIASGNVTHAYSGGYDAFALSVDVNLGSSASDTIAYYGGTGVERDAKVQFSNGKAWIAGQTTGDIDGTTKLSTKDGYLARLNIDTGAVEYQTRFTGTDGVVNPNAIAISTGGASVLDRLGLPQGKIVQTQSNLIIANTSVRTGDQFYMVDPKSGVKKTITIDANETMKSLATKIERASGFQLNVDVTKVLGKQEDQLNITPANKTSAMQFVSGPAGKDALEGLGLDAGLVSNDANKAMDVKSSNYLKSKKPMGLNFDGSINLNSDENIQKALTALKATMKAVQNAYTYLRYGDPQASDSSAHGKNGGAVPTYLTNQISNYQAALSRLTGGS